MSNLTFVLLAVVLGCGVLWFFKRQRKDAAEKQARVDRKARIARADAAAIKRAIDGRR